MNDLDTGAFLRNQRLTGGGKDENLQKARFYYPNEEKHVNLSSAVITFLRGAFWPNLKLFIKQILAGINIAGES